MSLVLDNSVALSWCFEDEHTPATLILLDQVSESGASVPALWPLEVLNGLLMAERRNRVHAQQRDQLVGLSRDLPITPDLDMAPQAGGATARLAEG